MSRAEIHKSVEGSRPDRPTSSAEPSSSDGARGLPCHNMPSARRRDSPHATAHWQRTSLEPRRIGSRPRHLPRGGGAAHWQVPPYHWPPAGTPPRSMFYLSLTQLR